MRKKFLLILFGILIISMLNVKVATAEDEEPEPTQWVDPEGREPSPKPPLPPLSLGLTTSVYEPKIPGRPYVYILVNYELYWNIVGEISRYVSDLDAEGIDAHVVALNPTTRPSTIREMIQTEYSQGAIGCLLVGDILAAWYEMSNPSPWGYEQFPTDIFYMDLDGIWTDTDNDGIYDQHSGDQEPEIWVGRLKASNMAVDEVSLIKNYFNKNHAYRTGTLSLPKRALIYIDNGDPKDSWTARADYLDVSVGTIFSDRTLVTDPATTTATDYLSHLQQGYYLVHLMAHGSAFSHGFNVSGPVLDPVRSSDIRSTDPKAFFYILWSCSNARYVERDYIAGWYVFSKTYGLAAVSSTKTGGMLGDQYFYSNFLGHNLGYAFKSWLTQALGWREWGDKWFYGMTIIGDPTLTLGHDVATLSVTPSTNEVVQGETVKIDVTVENQGSVPETFNVRCFSFTKRKPLNGAWVISMIWIDIGTQQVTSLDPGASLTLTFTWDTSGVEEGWYYDVSVRAELLNDADPEDNYYSLPFYLFVASPPTPPTVPEFSTSSLLITSIITALYITIRKRFVKTRNLG